MKINFKVILIYLAITVLLPILVSTYLASRGGNYFYNFNIHGVKPSYVNKLNLYKKVAEYMQFKPEDDDPSVKIVFDILETSIRSSNYKVTIIKRHSLVRNQYLSVVLRGENKDLENLDFEKYRYNIERELRDYFSLEKDKLLQLIYKLENLRRITEQDYLLRLSQYRIKNESNYSIEETISKLEREMASIVTQLENRILVPKLRVDVVYDIITELNEAKYFFEFESLGGADKTINIIFDHFIKFFILANFVLLLLNPILLKRAYKFLSVKN